MSGHCKDESVANLGEIFHSSEDYLEAQSGCPRLITSKKVASLIIDLTISKEDIELERMNKIAHDEYVAHQLRARRLYETNHERKKELRREARRWLGAVVHKRFGDEILCGRVADYEVENGWFKIKYDDEDHEEMSKDEVIQLLAQPENLRESSSLLPASSERHKPKRKKTAICKNIIRRPRKALLASAINGNLVVNPAISSEGAREKRPRRAKASTNYVPLAVSETKRDAYYWYWP